MFRKTRLKEEIYGWCARRDGRDNVKSSRWTMSQCLTVVLSDDSVVLCALLVQHGISLHAGVCFCLVMERTTYDIGVPGGPPSLPPVSRGRAF